MPAFSKPANTEKGSSAPSAKAQDQSKKSTGTRECSPQPLCPYSILFWWLGRAGNANSSQKANTSGSRDHALDDATNQHTSNNGKPQRKPTEKVVQQSERR